MTIISKCAMCNKHTVVKLGIDHLNERVKTNDKFFCSVKCTVEYIKSKNLSKYEIILTDDETIEEVIKLLNS